MPLLDLPTAGGIIWNSANLFLSYYLPSPLNANAHADTTTNGGFGYTSSHHCGNTNPRLHRSHRPHLQKDQLPFIAHSSELPSSAVERERQQEGANAGNAAAFESEPRQLGHRNNLSRTTNPATETTPAQPTRARRRQHNNSDASAPRLDQPIRLLPPPFRNRAAGANNQDHRPRNPGPPGRLWNPVNSTPRLPPAIYTRPARSPRKRRPSTPPPPSIPFQHPALDDNRVLDDRVATGAGEFPLLTLPEQRRSRHNTPTRSSFQIEERVNEGKRISLPNSVRYSYDIRRESVASLDVGPSSSVPETKAESSSTASNLRKVSQSVKKTGRTRNVSFGLVRTQSTDQPVGKIDKGKGKAVMSSPDHDNPRGGLSADLERGPPVLDQQQNRSNLSLPGGIGSAISSSNSSIIGDPDQPGQGDEWGPQHPCFPHLNPYVPLNSTEYRTTRIIRIRRDWLIGGDLAPAFSNMYPEILDPAGIPEHEFRRVVEKLNGSLVPIFSPYNWRNILDGVLGVLSAWIWEDVGMTNVKTKLNELEAWIEKWNAEIEKTTGSEEGIIAPRIISLRRTGYMSLDFQIMNPEVSVSTSEPASRSGPMLETATADAA
ncbi:Golgin subfamily A member 7/ERF4 family-domain-containing protein [Nemania sp. FL0916]|nr:Golgin subfamily A member 7/ERF4 family-domain-containing protein [Nemania sp. FL0916]